MRRVGVSGACIAIGVWAALCVIDTSGFPLCMGKREYQNLIRLDLVTIA